MSRFRDKIKQFRQANAEVLAVSIDSQFSHKAFAEQLRVDFPLLSDANREVIPQYGVTRAEQAGIKNVANRSVFVIDREGTVRYKWLTENPPEVPDVLIGDPNRLNAGGCLLFLKKSNGARPGGGGGRRCQARWRPHGDVSHLVCLPARSSQQTLAPQSAVTAPHAPPS